MIKILFICHGNICRSPMAEFVMKDMVHASNLDNHFEIASAAVSREEIGNCVYPPVKRILASRGISCHGKRARQITVQDYAHYDMIICMDRSNLQLMSRVIGQDTQHKVSLLLEHAGIHRDVADPWYTGDFEATWTDISLGCQAVLNKLIKMYSLGTGR